MMSVNNLSPNYLQSILSSAIQGTGLNNTASNTCGGVNSVTSLLQPDSSNLSPFAQLMSTLQQLQQSDPTKYQQVTQQIATNLQNASQTAAANGNSAAATQLSQLSTDFSNASKNGQLPNVQDLAQAVASHAHGHHHHHHMHAAPADSDANSTSTGSSSSGSSSNGSSSGSSSSSSSSSDASAASSAISQFLAAFQSNATSNDSLNPMSIIMNTLSQSGITGA